MKLRMHKAKQPVKSAYALGYTVTEPYGDFDTERAGICLWKALLMFSASFGTILSIVSAFQLQVNLPLLMAAFLLLSLLLSFLHYHHVLFNIGYPLAFFLFAFSIFMNRRYVNSGYQAIVNQVKADYREYFMLNYTGEAYEAVDNRYLAMTYAFLYLGFFLIVLLNIAISNYMSILLTVLLTFPFLQFGLYIEKMPSFVSIFLLLFVYAGVLFLKRSGHYTLSEKRKKDQAFAVHGSVLSYKGKGRVMGQLLGAAFAMALVFSLAAYPVMHLALPGSEKTSALKAATDTSIRTLVQSGFSSLFNRYDATGGISGGRLGGVNRIKADYETDLEVTFVPSSLNPVYLKAYTGAVYTGEQWKKASYEEPVQGTEEEKEAYENFTARLEARRLARLAQEENTSVQSGKMSIKNLGADQNYLYLPYYSATETSVLAAADHSVLYGSSLQGLSYTCHYYPYTQDLTPLTGKDLILASPKTDASEKKYLESYSALCRQVYTQIPENVRPELSKITEAIGKGEDTEKTVELIKTYLNDNYSYSLNPGATPQGQDFVTWFFEHQKKGFCTHFATAGTLLCRAYGIPARYVEGYVIQATDLADATPREELETERWYQGTGELEKTGVVTVEVPDANAHAWTEIYVENLGWVPVDFTPPAEDVDDAQEYSSFLQLMAGLFSVQQQGETVEEVTGQDGMTGVVGTALGQNSFVLMPLGILVSALLILILGWRLLAVLLPWAKRRLAYRNGRYDEVLSYDYRGLVQALKKKYKDVEIPALPEEVFKLLPSLLPETVGEEMDLRKLCNLLEKGIYGEKQLDREEADFVIMGLLACIKKTKI